MSRAQSVILTNMCLIEDENGNVVMQVRDPKRYSWSGYALPGGHIEAHEGLVESVIREVKEETSLDVCEDDLKLITVVSGNSRRNSYPNGDVVINNTALYLIDNYTGELSWNEESKEMKFFDIDNLPDKQNDPDLIQIYLNYLNKKIR